MVTESLSRADNSIVDGFHRMSSGRLVRLVVISGSLIALIVGLQQSPSVAAATPTYPANLPSTIDWLPEYHGQTLCSPDPKPGTLKFGALLDATYGSYTKYYTGSPCPNGLEHQEGRAVDWMVNSRDAGQREKAEAIIAWLLADGPNGEPAANARRLGILYMVWNNRIWGLYRYKDGWREYSSCLSSGKSSKSYDTSCHRNHIHFSLTWDGANAQTSWWTGKPELREPCPDSATTASAGSPTSPSVLINTDSGKGLAAKNCRLAGYTRYRSRSYEVKVPTSGSGQRQLLQITKFQNNAPADLEITGASTVRVSRSDSFPKTVAVPLGSDGRIRFSMDAGYASVVVKGLGSGAVPATLTAEHTRAWGRTYLPMKVRATTAGMPSKGKLVLQQQVGAEFKKVTAQPLVNGQSTFRATAPPFPWVWSYRVIAKSGGKVIAGTPLLPKEVRPPLVKLKRLPSQASTGDHLDLRLTYKGFAPNSTLSLKVRSGGITQKVLTQTVSTGKLDVPFEVTGAKRHKFWVQVRDARGNVIGKTSRVKVRVGS